MELKFDKHIIGNPQANPINFGECKIIDFFTGVKKIIPAHYGLELNYKKHASV